MICLLNSNVAKAENFILEQTRATCGPLILCGLRATIMKLLIKSINHILSNLE